MSNTMQLTERNLMVGDWLQYYIGEEGLEWEPTKIDWQDIKEVSENPEKFNKRHRPIPITEDVLSKCGFAYENPDYVNGDLGLRNIGSGYVYLNGLDGGRIYKYLHELQQLFRVLTGHELIINL